MLGPIELTSSDLDNILLWYHRAFHQKDDCSQSDKNTFTKLQAMLIIEQEDQDKFSRLGGFGR